MLPLFTKLQPGLAGRSRRWLVAAGLLRAAASGAQAQNAAQGFENSAADTWTYTPTPATYNAAADNDQWAVLPSVGVTGTGTPSATVQALPFAGANLWGGRDLEGPQMANLSQWHTLDFAPVALQTGAAAANTVSFRYFSNGLDPSDSLAYAVAFDNGTVWPAFRAFTQLNKDTRAWDQVNVAVPAGATHARLRLAVRQNGNDDWVAFDDVGLSRQATAVTPSVGLAAATLVVNENAGSATITLNIQNSGAQPSTVQVAAVSGVGALATATAGQDYALAAPATVTFPAGSSASQTLTVPITDDNAAEAAEYFSLRLQNPTNATLAAGATEMLVFVKDNDTPAPTQNRSLRLTRLGSYQNGAAGTNSAEIVAHDPSTQRLYIANSVGGKLDVVNFANPAQPVALASVSMAPYGGINSVAARGGVVACAVEDAVPQNNGKVVFFDANGQFIRQVTVGALPDMITFSPDGRYLITANEGEPNTAYTADPEGSVSVIDLQGGVAALTQANVTTVGFGPTYNAQAAALRAAGVRLYGANNATVAQDLEPEYVAVSSDSRTAYVVCQENNALATLDLTTLQFTDLRPLGLKDHSLPGQGFDASDQAPDVLIANWPVRGMVQPDAIGTFELPGALGTRYVVTANEGDAREYAGLTEGVRLSDAAYVLDPATFPQAALLKNNNALGRLNVTNKTGDTDGDGDFDQIHAFGGRSVSIYNAATGALVYDSGDLFEQVTSTDLTYSTIFNASNTAGAPARKNRSDDKGPEPEGLALATLRDTTYAFVALERIGGVMVLDVSNPAQPKLVQYVNSRSTTAGTGDLGPEGVLFVSAANSPTGQPLLLLANEVSSSVSVYGVGLRGLAARTAANAAPLFLYPNPAAGTEVRLSRPAPAGGATLCDVLGRPVRALAAGAERLATTGLAPGVYVLRTAEGVSRKLVVR